jgi:hypothetical protein
MSSKEIAEMTPIYPAIGRLIAVLFHETNQPVWAMFGEDTYDRMSVGVVVGENIGEPSCECITQR